MRSCFFAALLFVLPCLCFGQKPVTRQQMIDTAAPFATLQWTASATNLWPGTSCSGGRNVYFAPWVKAGTNVSVPYGWGGSMHISTFLRLIGEGKSAGDECALTGAVHCRGDGAGPDCVAGVDCSGFVCVCWQIPHVSTSGLLQYSTAVPTGVAGQRGDILDKPGDHVPDDLFRRPGYEGGEIDRGDGDGVACAGCGCEGGG